MTQIPHPDACSNLNYLFRLIVLFFAVYQKVYPINLSLESATFKISQKCHPIALEKGQLSKLKPCIRSYLFLKSLREVLTYRQPPTTGGFLDKLMPEGRGKLFFKKMSCGRRKKSLKKKLGNFHGPFFESNCNPEQQEGLKIWWGSCNPRPF